MMDDFDFEIDQAADEGSEVGMEQAIKAATTVVGTSNAADLERELRRIAHRSGISESDPFWGAFVAFVLAYQVTDEASQSAAQAATEASTAAQAIAGAAEQIGQRMDGLPEQMRRGGEQAGAALAERMKAAAAEAAQAQADTLMGEVREAADGIRDAGTALAQAASVKRAETVKNLAAEVDQVAIRYLRARAERTKLGTALIGGLMLVVILAAGAAGSVYLADRHGYFIPPGNPGSVRVIPGAGGGTAIVIQYQGRAYTTNCPASASPSAKCLMFEH